MPDNDNKTQSVTTSSAKIPANVQSAMDSSLGKAQSLFNNNQIATPYTGSTVVPYSENTMAGMWRSLNTADQARPGVQATFDRTAALGNSDGLNDGQRSALGSLSGIMSGANGTSNAESNLGFWANGGALDGSKNPYFSAVVDRASEGARDAVNMNFAGAGRYGSGANQQILAREVGDLQNRAYAGQYNNEVANMFGANQQMDSQRQQGIANQMQAAGDVFNGYQQGTQNAAGARAALPGAYQALQGLNNAQFSVGSVWEDLNARQMNDQLRIWQEQQQQPMTSVEWLNGIAGGNGALTGGQTQTIQAPKTSPFMAGLGGAATGFGVGGPIGAAIGGGAGLLGSLF